jgi:hypothetical protein
MLKQKAGTYMWFLEQKQGGLRKIMFAGWGPVKLQQEIALRPDPLLFGARW